MLPAPRSTLSALCFLLAFVSVAHAQTAGGVLDKTTFGGSQNTPQDLQNSLVAARPSLTKGEKKSEVDPRTLQSKTIKDPLFQGGLMDVSVDWTGDKLGRPRGLQGASDAALRQPTSREESARTSGSRNSTAGGGESLANWPREAGDSISGEPSVTNESVVQKQTAATGEKDSKTPAKDSESASDKESKSSKSASDAPNKDQKQTAAKAGDKPSDKEKSSEPQR